MYRLITGIALALSVLASTFAIAQDAPHTDETSDVSIVVTATRTAQSESTVPAQVIVITKPQIDNSPARNIDDLLRMQPGIDYKRTVGMASGIPASLSIRGVPGPNRVLILVDNMPLNASGTGFSSLNEIPLEIIQRIEIVEGPFSSLYGANAFSGVINIITVTGAGTPTVKPFGALGNEGYAQAGVISTGAGGRWDYTFDADWRTIDNYLARDTIAESTYNPVTHTSGTIIRPAKNYDYRDMRLFAKVGYAVSDTARLTINARAFDDELGYGQRFYLPQPEDTINQEHTWLTGLTYTDCPDEQTNWQINGYYRQRNSELLSENFSHFTQVGPPGNQTTIPVFARTKDKQAYNDWLVNPQWTHQFGCQELTIGADALRNEADFKPVTNTATGQPLPTAKAVQTDISDVGVYAQDVMTLGQWSVVPGVRVDDHSAFGTAVSPKLGVSYALSCNTRVRASAGRAFRAPTLSELYRPDWDVSPGVTLRANPDLDAEYLTAYDLGIEHCFTPCVKGEVDFFYNDMTDLIGLKTTGTIMQYVNIDAARSSGAEVSVEWNAPFGLTPFANYTYLDTKDEATGQPLEYLPRNKANLGLYVGSCIGGGKLTGSLFQSYVGEREYRNWASNQRLTLDNYWLTGLALTWKAPADRYWVQATVQNLFDVDYEETASIPAPGRLYDVQVGVRF